MAKWVDGSFNHAYVSPCKNCPNRCCYKMENGKWYDCHTNCEPYLDYQGKCQVENERYRASTMGLENLYSDNHSRSVVAKHQRRVQKRNAKF